MTYVDIPLPYISEIDVALLFVTVTTSFITGAMIMSVRTPSAITPPKEEFVTVMFCDLVDSTNLAVTLDPTALSQCLLTYFQRCSSAINAYAGSVVRFAGDDILAIFKHKDEHSAVDSALRATESAIHILNQLNRTTVLMSCGQHFSLNVRLSLATGPIVTSTLPGVNDAGMYVFGEVLYLAARLKQHAAANSIVISASTQELIGGHIPVHHVGCKMLKGFEQPVPVWSVCTPFDEHQRTHPSPARTTEAAANNSIYGLTCIH